MLHELPDLLFQVDHLSAAGGPDTAEDGSDDAGGSDAGGSEEPDPPPKKSRNLTRHAIGFQTLTLGFQ